MPPSRRFASPLRRLARALRVVLGGRDLAWGVRYLALLGQLALVVAALLLFHVEEDQGLLVLTPLVLGGFTVHALLPLPWRRPFFLGLSVVGLYAIVGLVTGTAVLLAGLALVGLCHLPVSWGARVTAVVAAGGILVALRAGAAPLPEALGLALPVLGSLFMFRLIVYLYDLRHESSPASPWTRLSYFFLLPNFAFLLFPVVDYGAFRRTWYDGEELAIYQRGLLRMLRGVSHLVAYRLVAYYLVPAEEAVQDLTSLVHLLVTSYGQLLRISGQFHLAVGVLGLFGWNLPRTQFFYYLASGFADYWRRANVYWRDFMVKLFLYPGFQRLRRLGAPAPLFTATLFVFFATWLLHGWQWFWLLGRVRLGGVDALFWGIFGLAVAVNALLESRRRRRRGDPRALGWSAVHAGKVLLTFAATCLLWSLWTSDSVSAWLAKMAVARRGGPGQVALVAGGCLALLAAGTLGTWLLRNRRPRERRLQGSTVPAWSWRTTAVASGAALLLALAGFSPLQVRLPEPAPGFLLSLTEARFGELDAEHARAGYYEELQGTPRLSSRHWYYRAKRWHDLRADPVAARPGWIQRTIRPSVETVYQGHRLRSNRWGMRDRDYEPAKPPGTFRVAVVGPSTAMGWGVHDEEVFDEVLEERLSREAVRAAVDGAGGAYRSYQVLNFSIADLHPLEQVVRVRESVLRFEPDLLLVILNQEDERRAAVNLARWHRFGLDLPDQLARWAEEAGLDPELPDEAAARSLGPRGPDLVRWTLREIAALARAEGARPAVVLFPSLGSVRDREALERMAAAAREEGYAVIDLSTLFGGERRQDLTSSRWDYHMGAEAHTRIARALHERLRPLLQGPAGPGEGPSGTGAEPEPGGDAP